RAEDRRARREQSGAHHHPEAPLPGVGGQGPRYPDRQVGRAARGAPRPARLPVQRDGGAAVPAPVDAELAHQPDRGPQRERQVVGDTMNQAALLAKFRRESLATASPAQLLTMLYDRLVLDLDRAVAALEADDTAAANEQLGHAQQIVHELRCSLDPTVWDGGPQLLELYNYLYGELVSAN